MTLRHVIVSSWSPNGSPRTTPGVIPACIICCKYSLFHTDVLSHVLVNVHAKSRCQLQLLMRTALAIKAYVSHKGIKDIRGNEISSSRDWPLALRPIALRIDYRHVCSQFPVRDE